MGLKLILSTRDRSQFSVITKERAGSWYLFTFTLFFTIWRAKHSRRSSCYLLSLNPLLPEFLQIWALLLCFSWKENWGVKTWLLTALLLICRRWKITFWLEGVDFFNFQMQPLVHSLHCSYFCFLYFFSSIFTLIALFLSVCYLLEIAQNFKILYFIMNSIPSADGDSQWAWKY